MEYDIYSRPYQVSVCSANNVSGYISSIPVWYTNKITIIDFTIYTQLFLVKLKSVVDGPILHSKSVVDRSILHCKAKVWVFSKI